MADWREGYMKRLEFSADKFADVLGFAFIVLFTLTVCDTWQWFRHPALCIPAVLVFGFAIWALGNDQIDGCTLWPVRLWRRAFYEEI